MSRIYADDYLKKGQHKKKSHLLQVYNTPYIPRNLHKIKYLILDQQPKEYICDRGCVHKYKPPKGTKSFKEWSRSSLECKISACTSPLTALSPNNSCTLILKKTSDGQILFTEEAPEYEGSRVLHPIHSTHDDTDLSKTSGNGSTERRKLARPLPKYETFGRFSGTLPNHQSTEIPMRRLATQPPPPIREDCDLKSPFQQVSLKLSEKSIKNLAERRQPSSSSQKTRPLRIGSFTIKHDSAGSVKSIKNLSQRRQQLSSSQKTSPLLMGSLTSKHDSSGSLNTKQSVIQQTVRPVSTPKLQQKQQQPGTSSPMSPRASFLQHHHHHLYQKKCQQLGNVSHASHNTSPPTPPIETSFLGPDSERLPILSSKDLYINPKEKDIKKREERKYNKNANVFTRLYPYKVPGEDDLSRPTKMNWRNYQRLGVINQFLDELESEFPSLCTVGTIGYSLQRRALRLLRISNGNANNCAVWMDAGMHAREWIGPAVNTYIANHLARNFKNLPASCTNKDWYFLPVINPDGYEYSHTTDRMWRKNLARIDGKYVGVDLNRNFSCAWGGQGSSGDPDNCFYRGPSPFSEPESTAVKNVISGSQIPFKVYITLHSFGEVIIFPFAHRENLCPDYIRLLQGATIMSRAIYETNGTTYKVGTSKDVMYVASGTSNDWCYGEVGIPYCYLIELRSKKHKFKPPQEEIEETGNEILNCVIALMDFVDKYPLTPQIGDGKRNKLPTKPRTVQ